MLLDFTPLQTCFYEREVQEPATIVGSLMRCAYLSIKIYIRTDASLLIFNLHPP
jgi:SUMO ligase MMS21 Smc5/6 complex component